MVASLLGILCAILLRILFAALLRIGAPQGCRCTRTFLGAPLTPRFGVSEARMQNPGRRHAPRERDGLFDIVRWELPKTVRRRAASSAVLILRSARAGELAQTRSRVRASRRMGTAPHASRRRTVRRRAASS